MKQRNSFYEGFGKNLKAARFPTVFDPRKMDAPLAMDYSVAVVEGESVQSFLLSTEVHANKLYIAALYGHRGYMGDAMRLILRLTSQFSDDPGRYKELLFVTGTASVDRLARGLFANLPVELSVSEMVLFRKG